MATRIIDYKMVITSPSKGQIGSMVMYIEDGKVIGIDLTISGQKLVQEDFATIQTSYNELKTWAQTNGYTWAA